MTAKHRTLKEQVYKMFQNRLTLCAANLREKYLLQKLATVYEAVRRLKWLPYVRSYNRV